MSVVEFAGITLGYWKKDIWDDETWTEGCGPSGEIGISVNHIYNVSDKKIHKIFFYCVPCDSTGERVGKEAMCECLTISSPGFGRFDEPDEDGLVDDSIDEAGVWERLWYAPTAQYVEITKVNVIYADGTKEDIDGQNIKFIDDDDSLYYKIIEEKEADEERAAEERRKAQEEKRKAEEERKKAEEEKRKVEEEKRKKEDRESRGIVAWAGLTDSNECIVEKIGNVTFYFDNGTLVGWESTCLLERLEVPAKCRYIKEACLKDLTTLVCPGGRPKIYLNHLANFKNSGVKRIVIPQEVNCISIAMRLGSVEEIEFEDPYGWGIKKSILNDPQKTYDYICKKITIKKSAIKAVFDRILHG